MTQDESIFLYATTCEVLEPRAFRAVLGNGHVFTAFLPKGSPLAETEALRAPGATVRVRMTPFDMSKGEIVSSTTP